MQIVYTGYAGGGFLLHPENTRDANVLNSMAQEGLVVSDWPGTDRPVGNGGAFLEAAPYGANVGSHLFAIISKGDWSPLQKEIDQAKADWLAYQEALASIE